MLLIKLSAEDLRMLKAARSPAEFEGLITLVRERIQEAEVLKSFGKLPGPNKSEARIRWDAAWRICKEILGDNVYKPPAPEYRWFQRIAGSIRTNQMDEEYVRRLAEYVKVHIPGKNAFHFIMVYAEGILAGAYDKVTGEAPPPPLEALRECQLPELE